MFLTVWDGVLVGKDPGCGVRSRKLSRNVVRELGRESVKAEIVEVPSKPGKDPVKSFIRQGGYPGFEKSILAMTG